MNVLEQIEPKNVFHFFEDLTRIPRPSGKEEAVSNYLADFARSRNLEYIQDELKNIIIIKEASKGYENEAPIILQGHMDMVCEKVPGCTKDMDKEGLDLEVSGDWISAKGTTLGGDDGIAVAYALALLDSDTLKHPRLEFVCTVGEEVGMDGASGIDCSPLKGHILLNMDSEDEGKVLAACAGGGSAAITLPVTREKAEESSAPLALHIHRLTGGHSGTEIDKGRASAFSVLGRLLRTACMAAPIRLVSLSTGSKDNAIPREGEALFYTEDTAGVQEAILKEAALIRSEYALTDPQMQIDLADATGQSGAGIPLTAESTENVITLFSVLPNGVIRMSDTAKGMVETSLNFGVSDLPSDADSLCLRAAVRSSVRSAFPALCQKLEWTAVHCGASFSLSGVYPAWEWKKDSVLRDKMQRIYQEMFGKELRITAIHAGVECGLLAGKIDNLDAVSMGPDILDIHTPQERLSISSVQRMYDFIVRIIEDKA